MLSELQVQECCNRVRDFLGRNPGIAGRVAAKYRLDPRRLTRWVMVKPPSKKQVVECLARLANDLNTNEHNVLTSCGISKFPPETHVKLPGDALPLWDVEADRNEIIDFLERHPRMRVAVARAFNINRRKLTRWLENSFPTRRIQHQQLHALAASIRNDETGVILRVKSYRDMAKKAANRTEPRQLMEQALQQTRGEGFHKALGSAAEAFHRAFAVNLESALELLPTLIYIGYRFGNAHQFAAILLRTVIPALRSNRKSPLPMSDTVRLSCLSQIGCALNEAGVADGARKNLLSQSISKFKHRRETPSWLPAQIARNQAHCVAWHDGVVNTAVDYANEARTLSQSPQNFLSVSNTLCEIYLHTGFPERAWQAISDAYQHARSILSVQCHSHRLSHQATFMHLYGSFFYGVVSRFLISAESYSPSERELDLITLQISLKSGGGYIRIGHRAQLSSRQLRSIPQELVDVIAHTKRENSNAALESALNAVERLLRN